MSKKDISRFKFLKDTTDEKIKGKDHKVALLGTMILPKSYPNCEQSQPKFMVGWGTRAKKILQRERKASPN